MGEEDSFDTALVKNETELQRKKDGINWFYHSKVIY